MILSPNAIHLERPLEFQRRYVRARPGSSRISRVQHGPQVSTNTNVWKLFLRLSRSSFDRRQSHIEHSLDPPYLACPYNVAPLSEPHPSAQNHNNAPSNARRLARAARCSRRRDAAPRSSRRSPTSDPSFCALATERHCAELSGRDHCRHAGR